MIGVLNHEELVEPLARQMLIRMFKQRIHPEWTATEKYLIDCQHSFDKNQLLCVDFNKVNQNLNQDLKTWKDSFVGLYKQHYRDLVQLLIENLHRYDLDRDYLIDLCVRDPGTSFVKTLSRMVSKQEPVWHLRGELDATDDVTVIRNIAGNEKLLAHKLSTNGAMWFVDSGYTNFLTGKKQWHRLVKNHIHHNVAGLKFPADRLNLFTQFPKPWNGRGDTILVVESSEQYYQMIGTTVEDWRQTVSAELALHTDRPVEFKSKSQSRKTRVSVYEQLRNNPDTYYCVISESSAAAIEAIWCGIPVITLGQHVSTPVAKTSLSDINNLYRGCLGDWLCALSYSQFTESEILDGTALKFTRKYFNV